MGGQRKSLLKWSQVPIEPVADGERRIDAGQVPKRWLTRRNGVPAALRPFTLRQEQSRHDENVSRTRLRCHRGTSD
jgi:hypothetical protein